MADSTETPYTNTESDDEILNELGEVVRGVFPPEGETEESVPESNVLFRRSALSREEVLERSQSWIDEQVPYSQSKFHENQFGTYRQDCSGFVSMCWQLDRSYTTANILTKAKRIESHDALEPGDALWFRQTDHGHMALFVRWSDSARTKPVMREERKTGTVCLERVWTPTWASEFEAIRANNLGTGGDLPIFRTRGSGVRIRKEPSTNSPVVTKLAGPTTVGVKCQARGESVTVGGITRDTWAFIPTLGGFITNIFIEGSPESLPGVPDCG